MTWSRTVKPTANWSRVDKFDSSYLLNQTGGYLLLQSGGKIIISSRFPTANWSRVAKP